MSKTQLKDRTLYYDGDSEVSPDRVVELLDKGLRDGLFVTEFTEEIKQFNRLAKNKITTKDSVKPLEFEWNIPEPYKSMDVLQYITNKWGEHCWSGTDRRDERAKRIADEYKLYEELDLLPILRAIIYVINTLTDKNIVWGVGRGSSVSSYVLYILGVHDVDSVKYDLDITDFLRRPE